MKEWSSLLRPEEVLEHRRELLARRETQAERGASLGVWVVFEVNGQSFALPAASLLRVLPCPRLNPVPGAPTWMAGISHRGGRVVVVVDLHGEAGGEHLLAELEASQLGFRFDRVKAVLEFFAEDCDPAVSEAECLSHWSRAMSRDRVFLLEPRLLRQSFRLSPSLLQRETGSLSREADSSSRESNPLPRET